MSKKTKIWIVAILGIIFFSQIFKESGLVEFDESIGEKVPKIRLAKLYEYSASRIPKAGIDICLDKPIMYHSPRKLTMKVTFKSGETIESIYEDILKPGLDKSKEGESCFTVNCFNLFINRRHRDEGDSRKIALLEKYWNKESIENFEVTVFKRTYGKGIYARMLIDIESESGISVEQQQLYRIRYSNENGAPASDYSSENEKLKAEVERIKKIVADKEARILKLIDIMHGELKEDKKK